MQSVLPSVSPTAPQSTVPLAEERAPAAAATRGRLLAIDALRGFAISAMALDHAAAAVFVSLQAETYGAIDPALGGPGRWLPGLFTNLASPTFWLLAGVSMALYAGGKRRAGESEAAITRFFLIRAAVLAVLDLTVAWFAWHGSTPYTHVLLSIAIGVALVAFLRLLPVVLLLALSLGWMLLYQAVLPQWNQAFAQGVSYWQALLVYYSYGSVAATEFSIGGWAPLIALGYCLGTVIRRPALTKQSTWYGIGMALLLAWAILRWLGGFGDLWAYNSSYPIHYFLIMNKTPPSLTFLLFNLGLAALLYAFLLRLPDWVYGRAPAAWLLALGQVSLFIFVTHLVIYGILGRLLVALNLPLPGVLLALLIWVVGLTILIPLAFYYRAMRRRHPDSVMRYL